MVPMAAERFAMDNKLTRIHLISIVNTILRTMMDIRDWILFRTSILENLAITSSLKYLLSRSWRLYGSGTSILLN